MRKLMVLATGFALMTASMTTAYAEPSGMDLAIAELKKQLPNLSTPKLRQSEIPGLWEITAGDQVFYWHPNGYLLQGEVWDVKAGKNISAEQREIARAERDKALVPKIAQLPLEKAVKIGNGKNIVIEFTDPDCPYCRRTDDFLSKRDDVTRYVFLFPLKMHKDAEAKSAYILSQTNRAAALKSVFKGAFDNVPVPQFELGAVNKVQENLKLGAELGVTGTPVLIVNGTIVRGADLKKLELLLESKS